MFPSTILENYLYPSFKGLTVYKREHFAGRICRWRCAEKSCRREKGALKLNLCSAFSVAIPESCVCLDRRNLIFDTEVSQEPRVAHYLVYIKEYFYAS